MTSLANLLEDHIVYQMKNIVGGLADKKEDYIERAYQDRKCSESIYYGLTHFIVSNLTLEKNDTITDPKVKLK